MEQPSAPRPSSPPLPTLSQLLQRHASFASPAAPSRAAQAPPPAFSLLSAARNDAHKRSRSDEDDEEIDEPSPGACGRLLHADEEETDAKATSPLRRPAKSRKPTYLIRKEEKEELLHEIRALQDQVVFLRQRFGVDEQALQDRQLVEKEVANHELRKSVRGHHFQVLAAQSAVCELTTKLHSECPIDTFIHLGREWTQRNETLSALKEPQLRQAAELLERRTQFFSEPREYVESSQFLSDAGDYCSIRFDMTPLEGMHSVKDAFDLIQHYLTRMQTRATPHSGTKFSSMDQMASDGNIVQRRMVLSQTDTMATEANFIMFSDMRRSDRSSRKRGGLTSSTAADLGLLVLNFVDQDELYPYDPINYVQHDLSGVIAVESVKRRVTTSSGHEKDESVIVLTRWVLQKLRRSKHHVPSDVMQVMRDRINEPANAILAALKEARPPLDLDNRAVPYLW